MDATDLTATRKIESLELTADVNRFLDLGWVLINPGSDGKAFVVAWMSKEDPRYPTSYRGRYHSDHIKSNAK